MSVIKFGTGGWRAIIGDTFTRENIEIVGSAVVNYIFEHKLQKKVVIGHDNRFLSRETRDWLIDIFISNGVSVDYYDNSVPTPLVMYYVKKHELDIGLMVTASHNPAKYNGIKIFTTGGFDASKEVTDELEASIDKYQGTGFPNHLKRDAAATSISFAYDEYYDHLKKILDFDAIRESALYFKTFLFDGMHGSGSDLFAYVIRKIFKHTGLMQTINTEPDANFGGIDPYPKSESLELDKKLIRNDKNINFGIAFDGDGDRLGFITNDGFYLDMNDLLTVFYWYRCKYNKPTNIVRNIATTAMLDKVANSFSVHCFPVQVGFKYISAGMIEHNAEMGGESSGGMTVKEHINGKDSIFAALLLLEIIGKTHKSIMALRNSIYTKLVPPIAKYNKSLPKNKRIFKAVLSGVKDLKPTISTADTLLYTFKDYSWVLIRASGTEPIIRVMSEAYSEDSFNAIDKIEGLAVLNSLPKVNK